MYSTISYLRFTNIALSLSRKKNEFLNVEILLAATTKFNCINTCIQEALVTQNMLV